MGQKIDIINNWNLNKLFSNLENGNFKIPKFQREYVWEKSKIVKLLNSIYKQYPIGSFFIWEAGKEYADFCRHIEELGLPEAVVCDVLTCNGDIYTGMNGWWS